MLRLHEFGWMTGEFRENIPHITNEEWTVILANCTAEQRTTLINLYQMPGRVMPNKGTGRATPTRAYQQILGNMFDEQVKKEIPTTNLSEQNQTRSSPQIMQFGFGGFSQNQ